MVRRVLLPVDESENSRQAFDFYLSNIHRDDDEVLLVHVQETPHLPNFSLSGGMAPPTDLWEKIIKENMEKMKKLEGHYANILREKKIPYKFLIEAGKPGETLVKVADERHVNFIVMGSRGQNALRRTLMGSVSDYVIHHVHIPVVVVPKDSTM